MEIIKLVSHANNRIMIHTIDEKSGDEIEPIIIQIIPGEMTSIFDSTYRGELSFNAKSVKVEFRSNGSPIADLSYLTNSRISKHLRYYVVKNNSLTVKHSFSGSKAFDLIITLT
jgi:hypothetical protein